MSHELTYSDGGSLFFRRRRQLLQVGGLGCLGLNFAGLLRAATQGAGAPGRPSAAPIKSCIMIFYYGGPSHIDTWDLKPHAPLEVRGEFQSIGTSVPGLRICEHMPRSAQIMHKLAVIRSMHHGMKNHNAAAVEALCGRTPLKGDLELLSEDAQSFPCYGSALSYMIRDRRLNLPYVALPHVMYNVVKLPGQTAGFLGSTCSPMHVEADPNSPNFRVEMLQLPEAVNVERLQRRESLKGLLDRQAHAAESLRSANPMTAYYDKAFTVLQSDQVRRSFDMSAEDAPTRERYGRNVHGQSVLLARRLVESGVPMVTVYDKISNGQDANWDSHENVFIRERDHLLPPADQALSALVDDLDHRGMLDSTLVIALGEFGRTPRVNPKAGRDHWPHCFSVVLAGGGVKGGTMYGTSDKLGAYPESDPVTPGDLAATLFWRFGLDPTHEIRDLTGRPYRLAEGEPVRKLFAAG